MRSYASLHAELYGPQPLRKVAALYIGTVLLVVLVGVIGGAFIAGVR